MSDLQHPSDGELQGFSQGTLTNEMCAKIEGHVSSCETCVLKLEASPQDTLARILSGEMPHKLAEHPRYRLSRRIGQGGTGVVYLGEDQRLADRP